MLLVFFLVLHWAAFLKTVPFFSPPHPRRRRKQKNKKEERRRGRIKWQSTLSSMT
jgi:hypothetical protein